MKPVLMGVNYHRGHSEGDYKIIVQNIETRRGPWVLYKPPRSDEKNFYLQHMVFPGLFPPEFNEEVDNPLKIDRRLYHTGDPLAIFRDFSAIGYEFVDYPMPRKFYEE